MSKAIHLFVGMCLLSQVLVSQEPQLRSIPPDTASFVTLFVYPPSKSLDYSTPKKLLRSYLAIEIKRVFAGRKKITFTSGYGEPGAIPENYLSTLGHAIVRFDCRLPEGGFYQHWASFSGLEYSNTGMELLLKDKLGMGVLFYDFPGGHIINGDENEKRLIYYQGDKALRGENSARYLRLAINEHQCAEMKDMVDFYEGFYQETGEVSNQDTSGRGKAKTTVYYSATIDPLTAYQERKQTGGGKLGGGCAPFTTALLKSIGLYDTLLDRHWKRRICISEKIIGGPEISSAKSKKIPARVLLLGKIGNQWEYPGYRNRYLDIYDPFLIWSFIGDILENDDKSGSCDACAAAEMWVKGMGARITRGQPFCLSDRVPDLTGKKHEPPVQVVLEGIVIQPAPKETL